MKQKKLGLMLVIIGMASCRIDMDMTYLLLFGSIGLMLLFSKQDVFKAEDFTSENERKDTKRNNTFTKKAS